MHDAAVGIDLDWYSQASQWASSDAAAPQISGLVNDVAACLMALTFAYSACYAASFPIFDSDTGGLTPLKSTTLAQRIETADLAMSLPLFPLMALLALYGAYDLGVSGDLLSRWYGKAFGAYWFQVLYIARMVLHTPLQWVALAQKPQMRIQMTLHHVLSTMCFGSSLMTGRMHFWAAFAGVCEVTTVFLNVLFAAKTFAPKDSYPRLITFSGVGLWFSFIFFRLMLFPMWLHMFYKDIVAHPSTTWDQLSPIERYVYPMVIAMVLILSAIWFVPITRGLYNALTNA